jgi:hypothetical protein
MDKPIFGGPGSSDPQIRVKIDGFDTKTTPYLSKTLNPVWQPPVVLTWPCMIDSSLSATIIVEDHNDFKGNELIAVYFTVVSLIFFFAFVRYFFL